MPRAISAKNIRSGGDLADRATIQISYAIGVSDPLSLYVDLHGTGRVDESKLQHLLPELVSLKPRGIREKLGLARPIYARTSAYGHFGREPDADGGFSWERIDELAPELAAEPSDDSPGEQRKARQRGSLYGRRKGPKLSAHQTALVEHLLPQLKLDLLPGTDPKNYFGVPVDDASGFEIGFGAGEDICSGNGGATSAECRVHRRRALSSGRSKDAIEIRHFPRSRGGGKESGELHLAPPGLRRAMRAM